MARMQTTHLCIDLEIRGNESDAYAVTDGVLDAGVLQDAINGHDVGGCGRLHVTSAVVRAAVPAHQDARRQSAESDMPGAAGPAWTCGCGHCNKPGATKCWNCQEDRRKGMRRAARNAAALAARSDVPAEPFMIFDPVARTLYGSDELPRCMNGKLVQYTLPDTTPVIVSPYGEVLTVHLTDENQDGSLYLALSHEGRGCEPILKLEHGGDEHKGFVRLGVFANADDRSVQTHEVFAEIPDDPDAPEDPCAACGNRGWSIYNGNEIQRCDDCKRYATDEDAAEAVEKQLAEFLGTKGAK